MRFLSALRRTFSRLNAVDWAQLHAKAAGVAWAIALFWLTPPVVADALGSMFVWVMTTFVVVGAAISSAGLIVAARNAESDPVLLRADLRRSLYGLGIEVVGIVLMVVGVLIYLLTQVTLAVSLPTGIDRVALSVLIYFTAAQLFSRFVSILHRRHKEEALAKTLGGTT